ncbi:MAG: GlxA family transcriptional regulator [Deltaproteobacteria bacterium]|nr:GlxA family transcriptional regulator [Deltaproteobacteria bacterium]MBI3388879.1 GlxA family transcriptional regulator [Deltaproteobacteria bacterium]
MTRRQAGKRTQTQNATRRVALVAFPGVQILDVTGPLEVFDQAARCLRERGRRTDAAYTIELLASKSGPITASSGVRLVADRRLREVCGIDTLLVAGGTGTAAAIRDAALVRWLQLMGPRVRRIGSVCSGAFILAEAGLLDGRRATTHWAWCKELAQRYPRVTVDPDPIFVRDGNIYTSAGVTAGMDLALALVEEDHGRELALRVARQLVLFLRRPGGQSQFSAQLAVQAADREPLRELQAWIADHLNRDLSVEALADRVAMSPRNFARVFTREVGVTPARFVEQARVEAARRRLEESAHGVDAIASQCGFGTAESMRRAFLRRLRVAPSAYRHRFASVSPPSLSLH